MARDPDYRDTANVGDKVITSDRVKGQRGDPEDYNRNAYNKTESGGTMTKTETKSTETNSAQGEEWLKNREKERQERQEKLTKLEEKWNNRTKESGKAEKISDEDLEIFKRVAGARKLYFEIRDEVAGIDMGSSDIDAYRNIRSQAYSEYVSLYNQLMGQLKVEFN